MSVTLLARPLDLAAKGLPRRGRGRPTPAAEVKYQEAVAAFCALILKIRSSMDFSVGARGWCYILEKHGLRKGEFDSAENLITACRKSGGLPLNICADDDSREVRCRPAQTNCVDRARDLRARMQGSSGHSEALSCRPPSRSRSARSRRAPVRGSNRGSLALSGNMTRQRDCDLRVSTRPPSEAAKPERSSQASAEIASNSDAMRTQQALFVAKLRHPL